MSESREIRVEHLRLDLHNFRTVSQPNEVSAITAMVSISPERFLALAHSIFDDGYLPTENIVVLESAAGYVVKEGNRRVAVLKIFLGLVPLDGLPRSEDLASLLNRVGSEWIEQNSTVQCLVFKESETAKVDRLVSLAHGKGEKAGRDQWNTVARARHNRDIRRTSEPGLDLLEKYCRSGGFRTSEQALKWVGDFPLTVLDEAIKRLARRLGATSAGELADKYPELDFRESLDRLIFDIGLQLVRFDSLRSQHQDFAQPYGFPLVNRQPRDAQHEVLPSDAPKAPREPSTPQLESRKIEDLGPTDARPASVPTPSHEKSRRAPAARPLEDPRSLRRAIKNFQPTGKDREKVATLRNEILQLKLDKNPLAFCFLLRSILEISAKAYCADHAHNSTLTTTNSKGYDRNLIDILRDTVAHLTRNKMDTQRTRNLHGAMTELGNSDGLLSVTSMNQLIHNPKFSVTINDICSLTFRILPLLYALSEPPEA